jgi:hypothetical protein
MSGSIVLGLYFGARAGSGDAHAAAPAAEKQVESARSDADDLRRLIADLQARGGEDTKKLVAEVSSERNIAVPAASPPESPTTPPRSDQPGG